MSSSGSRRGKKHSLEWAEWLRQEVLAPVPHRHVVVTIPRLTRPGFRRRRELLRDLAQCAADALGAYLQRSLGQDLRPGVVVSIERLLYVDGQQAVIYRGLKPNPRLGQNFVAMDPLEWLARMADHIPDPGRHRTLFYGHYANRARGARAKGKEASQRDPAAAPKRPRSSPSWARLISKLYQVDPLRCRGCGGKLQIVAYINDRFTIKKILDHLGLSPPEKERPPPEVRYVPLDEEGHQLGAVAEGLDSP